MDLVALHQGLHYDNKLECLTGKMTCQSSASKIIIFVVYLYNYQNFNVIINMATLHHYFNIFIAMVQIPGVHY